MKKIVIVLLAVILTACGTPAAPTQQPVAAPPEPSATPVVLVQTVVVEATQAPTEKPADTPVVVTVVVEPTQAPATQASAPVPPSGNAPISLDNALGKGAFTNMTMTSSNLTLRCAPRDITFNITTPNTSIVDVMFFYRVTDLERKYPKDYKAFGKMTANGNGNYTLTFTGEDVHPDLRIDGGWLDFQFVGLAKSGDVVDRSQIIESLVKYTFDCP